MSDDSISDAMNIAPMITIEVEAQPVKEISKEGGYETSKDSILVALDIGTKALEEVSVMARGTQDPRAYRVMTEMISAISNAARDLVDIKKIDTETKSKEKQQDKPNVVNQNLILTTDALQKLLMGRRDDTGN